MFPEKRNQGFQSFQGLSELINTLSGKGPIAELIAGAVTGAELADYVLRKADQYAKDQRHDDNLAKLVGQATRLYETGRISKAQFKAIIDQLPDTAETVEVKVKPVQEVPSNNQNEINEILKNVDPAKLAQLLEMLK